MSDSTKHCKKCKEEKPLSEFYKSESMADGRINFCKACYRKKANARRRNIPREESGRPTEADVIQQLRSRGIYAVPGKSSEFYWADVVAWGCVIVEVKKATYRSDSGSFIWRFSPAQCRGDRLFHIVLLRCDYEEGKDYHLIPSTHPILFNKRGKRRSHLTYIPNASHRKNRGLALLPEFMQQYQNNWELVNQMRNYIQVQMELGVDFEDIVPEYHNALFQRRLL